MRAMNWKILIALVLLLPVWCWTVGLAPLTNPQNFALHMAEEGEHCDPYGCFVPPAVEKPQLSGSVEALSADLHQSAPVIALLPLDHVARDRPPPLLYSLSHSLRAPPTLIPA